MVILTNIDGNDCYDENDDGNNDKLMGVCPVPMPPPHTHPIEDDIDNDDNIYNNDCYGDNDDYDDDDGGVRNDDELMGVCPSPCME